MVSTIKTNASAESCDLLDLADNQRSSHATAVSTVVSLARSVSVPVRVYNNTGINSCITIHVLNSVANV